LASPTEEERRKHQENHASLMVPTFPSYIPKK
jgi:hypothetical protein